MARHEKLETIRNKVRAATGFTPSVYDLGFVADAYTADPELRDVFASFHPDALAAEAAAEADRVKEANRQAAEDAANAGEPQPLPSTGEDGNPHSDLPAGTFKPGDEETPPAPAPKPSKPAKPSKPGK